MKKKIIVLQNDDEKIFFCYLFNCGDVPTTWNIFQPKLFNKGIAIQKWIIWHKIKINAEIAIDIWIGSSSKSQILIRSNW